MDAGLFLDRDGTIIVDWGYGCRPERVALLPGAKEALRVAARRFNVYLVTNQSGVSRGYFTLEDVEACNRRMLELLEAPDLFAGMCVATEHPDEPAVYRKPSPNYILERIERDGLEASRCWMVGDRLSDLQCGVAAGVNAALLDTTPHGRTPEIAEYVRKHGIPVFASLKEFVENGELRIEN